MKVNLGAGFLGLIPGLFLIGTLTVPAGAQSENSAAKPQSVDVQPDTKKSANPSQELILEPLPDTDVPTSTDGTYKSAPIGKRQKWQLDRGNFTSDEKMTGVKPSSDPSDDYSGIRLRRPKRR